MSEAVFQSHVFEFCNYAAIVGVSALIAYIAHLLLSD